ncbi:hypothetical protein [Streptomyces sp. NBC_01264]|uniref:hypothetical protein n=1 Tax=Streptomyces sp. NBC_01264 TaxID=2903804 RepID=UPI00224DBEAE|nr:hypothetical protein [Streptomyces sp. NBC_01264]MCX4783347.1 hypothetical protein [Streptomyces sp. NBC_01264]
MKEILIALIGVLVGAIGALGGVVGARIQARAARAQADAAQVVGTGQTEASDLQWLRSDRRHACIVLESLSRQFEQQAEIARDMLWIIDSGNTPRFRRAAHNRRIRVMRWEELSHQTEVLHQMEEPRAVLNLHGPDDLAVAAAALYQACVAMNLSVNAERSLDRDPVVDWETVQANLGRASRQFAAAARPLLDSPAAPVVAP